MNGYAPFVMPDKNTVFGNRADKDKEVYVHYTNTCTCTVPIFDLLIMI